MAMLFSFSVCARQLLLLLPRSSPVARDDLSITRHLSAHHSPTSTLNKRRKPLPKTGLGHPCFSKSSTSSSFLPPLLFSSLAHPLFPPPPNPLKPLSLSGPLAPHVHPLPSHLSPFFHLPPAHPWLAHLLPTPLCNHPSSTWPPPAVFSQTLRSGPPRRYLHLHPQTLAKQLF